jgi:Clr5 domain
MEWIVTNPQQEAAVRLPNDRNLSKQILTPEEWDSYRDKIYRLYVLQNRPLHTTMKILKEEHNLEPR